MKKLLLVPMLLFTYLSAYTQIIESDYLVQPGINFLEQGIVINIEYYLINAGTGPFNLQVELSDATGDFNNSTIIGSGVHTSLSGYGSLEGYICNVPQGNNYHIRVISATGGFSYRPVGGSNYNPLFIDSTVHEVTVFPSDKLCTPQAVTYSPTFAVFYMPYATYEWYKNGQFVSSAQTFTDNNPSDLDEVYLIATTPACVSHSATTILAISDTSAPTQLDITTTVDPNTPVCSGYRDTVNVVNLVSNATQHPDYADMEYQVIKKLASGLTTLTGSGMAPMPTRSFTLNRGEELWVEYYVADVCGPNWGTYRFLASSDTIRPTFHPAVEATITANNPTTICPGTQVDFNASIVNGAAAPLYRWYLNGGYVGNMVSYSTDSLQDGDEVWVEVIGSTNCPGERDTSNHMIFSVQSTLNVQATATPANCASDGSVTATPTNGTGPYTYLWNNGATTATVNNLPAGNYIATVTDATGCSDTAATVITGGALQMDSVNMVNATCATANDGTVSLFPVGAAPIVFNWSNGATTSSISGLSAGRYTVTVTDNNGCILVQTVDIDTAGLDAQIDVVDLAACATGTGGILTALPLNGTAPYVYNWSNGSTSDTATNLSSGGYTVTVTDDNACSAVVHQPLDPDSSCSVLLSGRVYVDLDSSCTETPGDIGVARQLVKIDPGFIAYTDNQGYWRAYVDSGLVYELTLPQIDTAVYSINCGVDTLSAYAPGNGSVTGLNWPRHAGVLNDASVSMNSWLFRPGGGNYVTIEICNNGVMTEDVSGTIVLDPAFLAVQLTGTGGLIIDSISSTSPIAVYLGSSPLQANQCRTIQLQGLLPGIPTLTMGQPITVTAEVSLDNSVDAIAANNRDTLTRPFSTAYDPNDKQVFADNESVDGLASPTDTLLEYLVRFQNTGNDTAFNVVIRDTLDELLDPTTFRLITASHPVYVQFYEDHIVHFIFDNILLPDSNVNEPASHGLVAYEIEIADPGLLQPISNQAAIYFDINPPIFTNTVNTVPAEAPLIMGDNDFCVGDTLTLSSTTLPQFDYLWTQNGNLIANATTGTLEVTNAGSYNIALVYEDDTLWSAPQPVVVNALPTVSLVPDANTACETGALVDLVVSPAGGNLNGTGVSGTTFDPAVAGAGTYNLSYEFTDTNNCSASATATLTVNANPTASLTLPTNALCEDAQSLDLSNYVSPSGGVVSGTGVSGTTFDPSVAGAGTYNLSYEFTDTNNCSASATATLTVNANPTVSLTLPTNALCEDAQSLDLSNYLSPSGGVVTGTGVFGTTFDPSVAGVGTYNLSYEFTDTNNCSASATATLTVNANPTASLTLPTNSLCEDAQSLDLSNYVSPSGGVVSGTGVSGTTFDPSVAGAGTYNLSYEFTDTNNCSASATATLTVNANPTASLTLPTNALCEDAQSLDLSSYVSPAGGVVTGTGVFGTTFDPAVAGAGTYNLSYEFTDTNNCSASATATLTVNANPTASFSLPQDPFCQEDAQTVDLSGYVQPAGGVINGTAVSGNMLDVSATGTYNLSYTYTDNNGCAATAQASAVVDVCIGIETDALPVASIHPNPTEGRVTISVSGQPIDEVVLLDVTGQQVSVQTDITNGVAVLDMQELNNGLYLVQVLSGDNWYSERVILQR